MFSQASACSRGMTITHDALDPHSINPLPDISPRTYPFPMTSDMGHIPWRPVNTWGPPAPLLLAIIALSAVQSSAWTFLHNRSIILFIDTHTKPDTINVIGWLGHQICWWLQVMEWNLEVTSEVCILCRQAVFILLECLLFIKSITKNETRKKALMYHSRQNVQHL